MTYRNLHSPAEHRRRRLRLLRGIASLAVMGFVVSLCSFQVHCAGIRREVLRLHVIAHSDRAADQQAKLYVRDKLLAEGAELFDGTIDAAAAEAILTPRVAELEACARQALSELGLDYSVEVRIESAYFNTRVYEAEGITLPAGRYQALRVILGSGQGQNWWCLMFPPLCLPAAGEAHPASLDALLSGGELRVVKSNPKYELRFKIVELWEGWLEKLRGGD